eukprot:11123099-Ditylum_brightwellii.AAC.1
MARCGALRPCSRPAPADAYDQSASDPFTGPHRYELMQRGAWDGGASAARGTDHRHVSARLDWLGARISFR